MKTKRKIFIAFILNLLFSIFEFVGGIITGSVAIASDAVHDFGDATSIGVSYVLEKLSDKKPNEKYTYGYARFSILGALITTLILLVSSCIVIYNALLRLINLAPIDYNGMIIFAVIGLTVNIVATYFTHGGKSINQKAVNLHMLEDVLGWLVVLIGAIVIRFTNCFLIDPILSILLSVFVIFNSIKNLVQILEIFLIRTPKNVDVNELIEHVKSVDGVLDVHHLHVWSIDGQINCATLHVVANEYNAQIKERVKEEFKEHGILHVVVEIETDKEKCEHKTCEIKRHESHHHCHHHH